MWGEDWGTMIWGNITTVASVPIPPWALIVFGMLLGICAIKAKDSTVARIFPVVAIALLPLVSVIAMNVPHQFQNGTVADANQVNENFEALEDQISSETSSITVKTIANGVFDTAAQIDHQSFISLCGDDNGCAIRICLIRPNNPSLWQCRRNIELIFNPADGNYRWDNYTPPGTTISGNDGNGSVTAMSGNLTECELSDADFTSPLGGATDTRPGFSIRSNVTNNLQAGDICSIAISN